MRIFLTGGTGFVGSNFINEAYRKNFEIIALRRSKNSITKFQTNYEPKWINQPIDTLNKDFFKNIDVVVHLAAHSANHPYDNLTNCLKYNLLKPLNFFNSALDAGVKKFVVAGSCFEYGNSGLRYEKIPANAPLEPTSSYPASKAAGSIAFLQWARENQVSMSLLRFFQIYGKGELSSRLYPSLISAALNDDDFPMTKGEQLRDFINVVDLVNLLFDEVELINNLQDTSIKIQNMGSNKPQTVLEFSEKIWNQYAAKGKLLPGVIPYRKNEVMKVIPCLKPYFYK